MNLGIKTLLKKWRSGAKVICHRVDRLVEWWPRGSGEKYPYLVGDALRCERWQGHGRCMFFHDEVDVDGYVSCYLNNGMERLAVLIQPAEGVGDSLKTAGFEVSVWNGKIVADSLSLEERRDELEKLGGRMGYSLMKDPRNLVAVYALEEGIVWRRETCRERSPEGCRIW